MVGEDARVGQAEYVGARRAPLGDGNPPLFGLCVVGLGYGYAREWVPQRLAFASRATTANHLGHPSTPAGPRANPQPDPPITKHSPCLLFYRRLADAEVGGFIQRLGREMCYELSAMCPNSTCLPSTSMETRERCRRPWYPRR